MPTIRLTILDPLLAREFDVPLGVTLVGREPSTNLPVQNPQVSRRHAQLVSDGTICELIDLGSANGTFINDERLTPQAPRTLEDGMRLRFGPVEVAVQIIPDQPVIEEAADQPAESDSDLPVGAHRDAPPLEESPHAETPAGSASATLAEPDAAELVLDRPGEPSTAGAPLEAPLQGKNEDPDAASDNSPPEDHPSLPETPADELALHGERSEPPGAGGSDGQPPPGQPPSTSPWQDESNLPENPFGLPGLSIYSRQLINQLPGIYQTDFMARFLGIFESIHTPIEWTLDSFDLYLDPDSSPAAFLTWLGSWYGLTFDSSWTEDQRRLLIAEAHAIFARRGTRWAMARLLEIYTGCTPEIVDTGDGIEPFTFRVRLALPDTVANRTLLTRLIDAHKPAYTTYRLELMP